MTKMRAVITRDLTSGRIVAYFPEHPESRAEASTLDEAHGKLQGLASELFSGFDEGASIETVAVI